MNQIKFLIVALIAILAFASCSEDEPARMLWEVSGKPAGNVETSIHYDYNSPVWITVGGYAAEVILKCTNYSELSIYGQKNEDGKYVDSDCRFSAKVIDPTTVRISFDYMEDVDFTEKSCYLQIDGINGKDMRTTMVTITRKHLNYNNKNQSDKRPHDYKIKTNDDGVFCHHCVRLMQRGRTRKNAVGSYGYPGREC